MQNLANIWPTSAKISNIPHLKYINDIIIIGHIFFCKTKGCIKELKYAVDSFVGTKKKLCWQTWFCDSVVFFRTLVQKKSELAKSF